MGSCSCSTAAAARSTLTARASPPRGFSPFSLRALSARSSARLDLLLLALLFAASSSSSQESSPLLLLLLLSDSLPLSSFPTDIRSQQTSSRRTSSG